MPPKRSNDRKQSSRSSAQYTIDQVLRRHRRYLDELERANYHRLASDGAAEDKERLAVTEAKRGERKKSTQAVRGLLLYRKNLQTLIDESGIKDLPQGTPSYLTVATPAPVEPAKRFCISCGYWGAYRCQKCGEDYCSKKCGEWHDEFRCGKL
ncbi:hypothetical protein DACRYDRAFT_113990 [Dacryopinax primogenitus]|uniref:HIT-type domain-containing protein n=1 Tax=Dacryopinax primogenitus (strain DJM 731) TaxID=1858805 RepID=M5G795_DACPD|nr:uncharacterized protein DACRYDRAFT_113990 [Dacryopinax primogenitus]EJU04604.1 hypothetical protein DACRYDRAFT_113990 [Dacryopinax primogenitus]